MRKLLACLLFVGNNERKIKMKSLITITTVVLLVGCGTTQLPKISIHEAVENGDIKTIKQHLAAGTDVNAAHDDYLYIGITPLHWAKTKKLPNY